MIESMHIAEFKVHFEGSVDEKITVKAHFLLGAKQLFCKECLYGIKSYCENENDMKIIGTSLRGKIALKNLKAEEHMFVANRIYSSYY